ncbi:uncharacterized protein LOC118436829 [Folsomia candida]|uniref:uncharacterized protein LOC118436829 n=1 Tax=Folsomia candida TaxID=158441 RepID=UPI001604CACF|nr:uncharacterized protein LOC118436829 [Folsomia candida]
MRKSDLRLAQVEVVDIVKQLEEFSAEKAKLMKLIMARDVNHHIVQEMRKVLPSTVGDSDEMVERIMAGTLAIVEALSQQIPSGTNTSETEEKMLDSLTKIKEVYPRKEQVRMIFSSTYKEQKWTKQIVTKRPVKMSKRMVKMSKRTVKRTKRTRKMSNIPVKMTKPVWRISESMVVQTKRVTMILVPRKRLK